MTAPTTRLDGDILPGAAAALAEFLCQHPGQPVTLIVNSAGGDAAEGAALAAEVERHGLVDVTVRGICASAATLPMVAARSVTIHPAAMVMIHEPGATASGTADHHRQAADALQKIARTYAGIYARHTGHPVETILAWMKAETWMDAHEAVELRFADQIEAEADELPMVARADYAARFRAAPESLRRLAAKHGWAADPSEPPKEQAHA